MATPPRVDIDAAWLADAYGRGLSLAQLAAEAGMPRSTVRRRLLAFGIPTRPPGIGSTRRDPSIRAADVLTARYLAAAQRKGLSAAQIGKATGFCGATVARHLSAHGLPVGPPDIRIEVDQRRLARIVAKGVSTAAIAAEFGCSTWTINRRLHDYGIRAKAPAFRRYDMPVERLAEMKNAGWTLERMAAEFGCHFSTVSLRLLKHGLR